MGEYQSGTMEQLHHLQDAHEVNNILTDGTEDCQACAMEFLSPAAAVRYSFGASAGPCRSHCIIPFSAVQLREQKASGAAITG